MNRKLSMVFYWAASCGGCEIAVLDINEKILDVAKAANIVFSENASENDDMDIESFLAQVRDHVGTFYMYSLPASILRGKITKQERGNISDKQ